MNQAPQMKICRNIIAESLNSIGTVQEGSRNVQWKGKCTEGACRVVAFGAKRQILPNFVAAFRTWACRRSRFGFQSRNSPPAGIADLDYARPDTDTAP